MSCYIYSELNTNTNSLEEISDYLNLQIVNKIPVSGSFLEIKEEGLCFINNAKDPLKYLHIDFLSGSMGWRLKRSDHENLLKKTLGKNKDKLIIFDATAGFLSDAMIFLAQGHKVIACEQSKIVYLLVKDAIDRAAAELPYLANLEFINGDSIEIYNKVNNVDLIYLDPMYPEPKKNLLRSGSIDSIKDILQIENIENKGDLLFHDFKKLKYKKIVLKRPIKADEIDSNVNYQIKGKSTRYDIYI